MLPNRFVDQGDAPEYNTVDASLWYVVAVHDYLSADRGARAGSRPRATRPALAEAVQAILDGHVRGTRYGIRVDGRTACSPRVSPASSSPGWTRRWATGW